MYSKVFEQIYDSSIAEDWQVRLVFEDFLTLADVNGVVDRTPEALSRRTNVPLEIVKRAIAILEAPDPTSRRKEQEGRRLVRLDGHRDWGWIIVNYQYYRDLASEEQRRLVTRERVKRFRLDSNADVTPCNAVKRSVRKCNDSPYTSPSPSSSPLPEGVVGETSNPKIDLDRIKSYWTEIHKREAGLAKELDRNILKLLAVVPCDRILAAIEKSAVAVELKDKTWFCLNWLVEDGGNLEKVERGVFDKKWEKSEKREKGGAGWKHRADEQDPNMSDEEWAGSMKPVRLDRIKKVQSCAQGETK